MINLPEDQEVVLSILSNPHIELTNECAMRWRVGHPYRASAFLDVIRHKYERDEVPIECLPEAMVRVTNEIRKNPLQYWMWQDVSAVSLFQFARSALSRVFNSSPLPERLPPPDP